MKLGLENKRQTIMLGGLLVVLMFVLYTQVLAPGDNVPVQARTTPPTASRPDPIPGFGRQTGREARPRPSNRVGARTGMQFKMNGREDLDPATIDPTLRLDLLAKVQTVTLEGGERNLFQFGSAPMPKTPEPKIIPKPVAATPPPVQMQPAEPVKPPPPPIPLKFYGYSQARPGEKRAFFLDGEEIIVANEGDMIQRRYKLVRIGVNSVVVEDTQHNHRQTLPLQEPAG
jgi:hypothetical protein